MTTSEIRYGISKQPAGTCALIDEALDDLKKALGELDGWQICDDVGELQNKCYMGSWCAYRLFGTLEKIRTRASEIRDWGQEWKTLAKKHAPEDDESISVNQKQTT